jgi:hypothetical protein
MIPRLQEAIRVSTAMPPGASIWAIQRHCTTAAKLVQRPGGTGRTVCAMKRVSGSFLLSTTIEIPGEQKNDSGSNESTEKCPGTSRIRFFGSDQYSRKRHL